MTTTKYSSYHENSMDDPKTWTDNTVSILINDIFLVYSEELNKRNETNESDGRVGEKYEKGKQFK